MFGNALAAQYGDTMPHVWQQAVRRLRDDEVKQGLANIAKQAKEFPPNLGQFVAACRAGDGVDVLHARIAAEETARALPHPPGVDESQRSGIYHALMQIAERIGVTDCRGTSELCVFGTVEAELERRAEAAGHSWPLVDRCRLANAAAGPIWLLRNLEALEGKA